MTIKVLSNLDSFAFVDVVKLLKKNPNSFTAEYVFSQEANDSIYYFTRLKKEFKKTQFMITLADEFLVEFQEGKLRDYVFERILEFQLFRIGNVVYHISEDIKTIADFFYYINTHIPQKATCQLVSAPLTFSETIDYVIFEGTGDPKDILNLAKFA